MFLSAAGLFSLKIITHIRIHWASLVAQMVKNLPAMQEMRVQSLGQEDPQEEGMEPTPVFLPGECHGQRNQAGYSPWSHKSWTRLK